MENILNFIVEEKSKLDAEKIRRQAEQDALHQRQNNLFVELRNKLLPLENLIIQGEKCTLSELSQYNNTALRIDYGVSYIPKYGTYATRSHITITFRLVNDQPLYTFEGDFSWQVSKKLKDITLDEVLQITAKHLAMRI